MEIYLQSRGIGQEHDYCWLNESSKIEEEPGLVKEVKNLIQNEATSVVLARNSDKLLLLVTGLKSSERRDYRGRTIRNSVAWIARDTEENECILRAIAARALRGSLGEEIDHAVDSRGETGFEVSFNKIQQLAATLTAEKQQLPLEREKQEIKQTSKENKEKLAEELEQYCLPKQKVPLVVVTEIQDKGTLENARVWRGMSKLITTGTEENQQPKFNQLAPNIFQWRFDRFNIPILKIGFSGTAIALIAISYLTFQLVTKQSPAASSICHAVTSETLVFYAKGSEVDVNDESLIKVVYDFHKIKDISLVDKDGKSFDTAEEKTNNDSKRELTYRPIFDSSGMHQLQLQGTNIATGQPICEQSINIQVRPE